MRTGTKAAKFALEALEAASDGFEIIQATRRYQRVLINEGLSGIRRVVEENRRRELRSWLRTTRRARLVEAKRIGNRLRITLTETGRMHLLKLRIRAARRLPREEMILVAFDFPVPQKRARNAFRYFLKTCGFEKLQQSVWRSRSEIELPLREFIRRCAAEEWILVFRVAGT